MVFVCLVGRGRDPTYPGWRAAHWRQKQLFSWEFCFLTPCEQQVFHPSPSYLSPVTQDKTEVTPWRVLFSQADPAGGCLLPVAATWTCAGEEQDLFFILDNLPHSFSTAETQAFRGRRMTIHTAAVC